MNNLTAYLEQFGLLSLEKQDKLSYLTGEEHPYELDLGTGNVCFGNIELSFQVLGTESDNTLTWLWAWADEQTEIPEMLLTASQELRDWGRSGGIKEFTIPSVDLNNADGFIISLIASEVCKASCYYRDTYEGGALFLLLFDNKIDIQPPFDLIRFRKALEYLNARYDVNHRNLIRSYLTQKGLILSADDSRIIGKSATGEEIIAEFDSAGRLLLFNGEIREL